MIIKSMSRKAPTFLQLANYIERGAGSSRAFAHNLYHQNTDTKIVADQFLENYRFLPKRSNGNALLHEVLVLEPQPHLSKQEQIIALERLAHRYCETRASDQLAWGRVHLDTDYPHIHLMISTNAVRSKKSARLSKTEFARCQRELETFKQRELPELRDRVVYHEMDRSDGRIKTTSAEGELIRRTGKASEKQELRSQLSEILNSAKNVEQVTSDLGKIGFELYRRGQKFGVKNIHSGRKHRLSTLGLVAEFEAVFERERSSKLSLAPTKPHQTPSRPSKPNSKPKRQVSPDRRSDRLKHIHQERNALERAAEQELNNFQSDEDRER